MAKSNRKKDSVLDEEEILLASAKSASSKAIRSSTALGLTIKVIKNQEIVAINPDKSEVVIRKIERSQEEIPVLKKGTKLKRK